jgi:hypothetical protein
MGSTHPLPWQLAPGLAADLLLGRLRSLRADALVSIAGLNPGLEVLGGEFIPQSGPCQLTVNHYTRPGLPAWWLVLATCACVPVEIHWIMTSAWTYPDPLRRRLVTPLTRVLFGRIARMYKFTSMPPMPPDPEEVEARARAVRQVLEYARQEDRPVIGLAPEGRDSPQDRPGELVEPPPGVGRFVLQLNRLGLPIYPVGVYEQSERLRIHFGRPYDLEIPEGLNSGERDRAAGEAVMMRIAKLLPRELHGGF